MSEVQLSVQGVSKRFGGLVAVNDVSFDVSQGNLVSLIGPNGAGKTTLFNSLTGQLAPSAGKVIFEGADIGALPPNDRARLGFGRTFQISQTLTSLTALENAMIGAFLRSRSIPVAAELAYLALEKVGLGRRDHIRKAYVTLKAGQELNLSGEAA